MVISIPCYGEGIDGFSSNSTKEGYKLFDVVTYYGITGKSVTCAWDPNPEPDISGYKLRVYYVEQERYVATVTTSATKYKYTPIKSGHYVFEVRAIDLAGNISDWTSSLDSNKSSVNGEHKGWWVYVHIAPAGGLIIN